MFENLYQLKTLKARRVFGFVAILLLVLEASCLALVQYKAEAIPEPYLSVLREVLVNLTGASITAMLIVALFVFLLPLEEKFKSVELLAPAETKALHDHALVNSDFWLHNGHIGRWVRTTALPALAKAAGERGVTTTVKLIVLNPNNQDVCELYTEYRNRIAFKESTIKNIHDVQAELLATILISQKFAQRSTGLIVEIFLSDQLTLLREDISATVAFSTHVDPRCPSLVYRNLHHLGQTSEFYNVVKTNFDFASRCCRRLPLPAVQLPEGLLTTHAIRTYLEAAGIEIRQDDRFLTNVLTRVQSDYHPYT